MDKNAIKKYAVWARRELISRVSQKALQYGITDKQIVDANADSVNGKLLSAEEKHQRAALIKQINQAGYEQVMEEVAYTWFNRFCALRFMEVNGYLPTHIRVFSDDENSFKPQILSEAINLDLAGLNIEKVYKLKNENKTEDLYKYLLIVQCNALSSILPGMFQKISDYTELLFPDNLLREGSVVEQLVTSIPEEDWKDAVQILGWLYQFYNIEPKDKVFADLKKNIKINKDTIPAATQLFTPDWIVRYMVENSLGRLWIEGHPNSSIKDNLKYYVDDPKQEEGVQSKLDKIFAKHATIDPKTITCIDPCMGSGHILVYMFDVLVQIYGDYGYNARDAVQYIVRNNIYGIDIDERAAQLAYFAVMMKARQYDRRFFERGIQPQVLAIQESNNLSKETFEYIVGKDEKLRTELQKVVDVFKDAKEYGSILEMPVIDYELLYNRFDAIFDDMSLFQNEALEKYLPLVKQAETLGRKYDVVVTNPPYMGNGGMDSYLTEYVKDKYPNTKSDLSTVFMEKSLKFCKDNGFISMINIPVWMFLTSYEYLRREIINNNCLVNMIHLGRGVFGSDFGTTAFVIGKNKITNYIGTYFRLFNKQGSVDSVEEKEQFFFEKERQYFCKQENFSNIPNYPIAYWLSKYTVDAFAKNKKISESGCVAKKGLSTGNNDKFLRFWHEVYLREVAFNLNEYSLPYKWVPINKGGSFRKWFGNNEYIIEWYNDGYEIKHYNGSVIRNSNYYFQESITWTMLSASCFGVRYSEEGKIFEGAGPSLFTSKEKIYNILALLCSKTGDYFIRILNPTININIGDVENIPAVGLFNNNIQLLAKENVALSKQDWDSFETSWEFKKHPLI